MKEIGSQSNINPRIETSETGKQKVTRKAPEVEKTEKAATESLAKEFSQVAHKDILFNKKFLSEHKESPILDLIRRVASKARVKILEPILENKKKIVKNLLENVSDYVQKVKIFENQAVLKVGKNENSFKIFYDKKKQNECQLVFNSAIAKQVVSGQFKKTQRGFQITEKGEEPLLSTKEHIGTKEELSKRGKKTVSAELRTQREQRTLEMCAKHKIPGTPKTFLVSYYVGKGNVVKQRIMQKFYPGGNLAEAVKNGKLTEEQNLNIAKKMCKTLAEFHKAGMSHNDYRPDNIVLDENLDPILIDFGGTTTGASDTIVGSKRYFPPEMIDRKKMDAYDQTEQQIEKLENEQKQLEESFHKLDKKHDELEEQKNRSENQDDKNQITSKMTSVRQEIDDNFKLQDNISHQLEELYEHQDKLFDQINNSSTLDKWIPQKNDDFALGLTLAKLFGDKPPTKIQAVINGLKETDPEKRITAGKAFEALEILG